MNPDRNARIFCATCRRKTTARNGPVRRARKWVWINTCTQCGAKTEAPSKEPIEQRALERSGQRRLFE